MGCFCFNCKCQKPKWSEMGCCDRCALIISTILFLMFFIELVAYSQFIHVFSNADGISCCGAIDESSSTLPGAVCFEDDFPEKATNDDPKIPMTEINGSYFCIVNDVVCDKWTASVTNFTDFYNASTMIPTETYLLPMTFDECLAKGGFSTNDICNEYVLTEASSEAIGSAITWCWIAICFGLLTASLCLCEFVGCFKESTFCENRAIGLCLKSCEVLFWLMIVIMSITVIENPAGNGYASNNLFLNEAYEYMETNCNYDTHESDGQDAHLVTLEFIWTELELNVPKWLTSNGYNFIGYTGIALSCLEFSIFFCQLCCMKKKKNDQTVMKQTNESIQMS